jgi:hypothetical protein
MPSLLFGVWVVNDGDPGFGYPFPELRNFDGRYTKQMIMNSTTPLEFCLPEGLKFDSESTLEALSKTR